MSEPDLTKLGSTTQRNAFKNNAIYEGIKVITGSVGPGLNERTFTVDLDRVPDLVSALFQAPTDNVFGSDPRPNDAWFKKGAAWVLGNNVPAGYVDYPVPFEVTMKIQGLSAIIKLQYVQQFTDALTLTNTNLYYRILDYSVF